MRRGILLVVLTLLLPAGCAPPPDFVDVAGVPHRYADFEGKWIFVNYWATWCGPCIREIPELNQFTVDHGDKAVVLGVNFDAPAGDAGLQQANKMKISFPVYSLDPSERLGVVEPEVLPTTFVFAPGLKLKATLIGPQTRETLLQAMAAD